ncbi:hypothetical protein T459_32839 [Capsicum annuum]|uniref:RNase H type-1 domain-containing protein n=1 Tax=Capsicum annuum TaxID=4072 RepID=A0A2G2Y168_CAPAN|nr:hypothetical protein FXO37_29283 [Capsicum annuum]PHT63311.1 hypothetical protein T459_32839 [Capsicum annuum]
MLYVPARCSFHAFLNFDGSSKGNPGPAGAGVVLRAADGSMVFQLREGLSVATDNVAEYKGLMLGLKYVLEKGELEEDPYDDPCEYDLFGDNVLLPPEADLPPDLPYSFPLSIYHGGIQLIQHSFDKVMISLGYHPHRNYLHTESNDMRFVIPKSTGMISTNINSQLFKN